MDEILYIDTFQNNTWLAETPTNFPRYASAAAQFADTGLWWITGGYLFIDGPVYLRSTELYDSSTETFTNYVDLPEGLSFHNLVNINSTHMVVLGGPVPSADVYMFDR